MTSASAATSRKRAPVKRGEARERLLRAARELIIAQGMEGVSIRAINAAAGVSPGILHYHFGTLDDLVAELVGRYMEPLMRERERLLDERRAAGPMSVRDVAEVMILPLARIAIEGGEDGIGHVRLLARLYADRNALLQAAEQRWAQAVNDQLFAVLQQCNPEAPTHELVLRQDLAAHALLRGLAALHQPPFLWQTQRGLGSMDPWDQVRLVVDFVVAGLAGRPA